MPTLQLLCPHCQTTVSVSGTHAGQTRRCPACSRGFQVPVAPPPPAPVEQPNPFEMVEDASPREPEPWYYSYLEGYAQVVLYLGIGLTGVSAALVLVFTARLFDTSPGIAILAISFGLLAGLLELLLLLVLVAAVLLFVDLGRNVRRGRQALERRQGR